jgi:tRNA A58 N-methylase Trm61
MKLEGILPFTRSLLTQVVQEGDIVVDATMGNGIDTLFLAKLVGHSGTVLAYDIQQEALDQTRNRLEQEGLSSHVRLFLKGHQTAHEELQSLSSPISAAMFNLGYRPGGDKSIVTVPDFTIQAIHHLAQYLKKDGLITLVVYPGHDEGKNEKNALLEEVKTWDQETYQVLQYGYINQRNSPPFLIAIQKK